MFTGWECSLCASPCSGRRSAWLAGSNIKGSAELNKYRKFWSISLEHFVEHKPQVSEECDSEFGFILVTLVICASKYFCKQTYIADTPVFFLGSCCLVSYYCYSKVLVMKKWNLDFFFAWLLNIHTYKNFVWNLIT